MTTVSIILPTKNVENNIGDLLRSIYRQDFSGEIETIILDSSDDKTPEIAKGFPVKFIHVEEDDYNYGGTRNYGASLAKGKFVVEGLKYLKAECQYIVSHGNMKHLPYAMFYEFMRFLGYFLGSHHKYMPLWLKVRLCNKKNHWKKYDDIVVD